MDSNDEAVEAFIVDVLKRADIQRHIPLPDDERDAYNDGGRWEEGAQAVRLLQAGKIIAAVRAEAVVDERSAEERLQGALAAAGEAIEAMPWDHRFEAVSTFLAEHPIDRPEAFLIGVAVVAHQMRLDRDAGR